MHVCAPRALSLTRTHSHTFGQLLKPKFCCLSADWRWFCDKSPSLTDISGFHASSWTSRRETEEAQAEWDVWMLGIFSANHRRLDKKANVKKLKKTLIFEWIVLWRGIVWGQITINTISFNKMWKKESICRWVIQFPEGSSAYIFERVAVLEYVIILTDYQNTRGVKAVLCKHLHDNSGDLWNVLFWQPSYKKCKVLRFITEQDKNED